MISAIKILNKAKEDRLSPAPVILREMSITSEQFANRLPRVRGSILDVDNAHLGCYKLRSANGPIKIICEQKTNRQIGALSIPVMEVSIDLRGYKTSKIKEFMESFDQIFLKMGG